MGILTRLFDHEYKELKRFDALAEQVLLLDDEMTKMTDMELKSKTGEFKSRLSEGETLDDILVEAFAVVREAAYRVLGEKPYKVQIIGGICIHYGNIAEMKTGEGKTLTSTLPAYLNALSGEGVHIVTVNEFLAQRDSKWMGNVFEFLGFEATLLGGAGKTDILLRTPTTKELSFVVAIDAKSTASGTVTENLIDFDTIKEHKKKHSSDYNVIVGANFQGLRLMERAKEHNVLLLDIDKLESIIRDSKKFPLSFDSYKKLFEQSGLANIDIFELEKLKVKKQGVLIKAIMDCLIAESEDKFIKGILNEREIYRSLRNLDVLNDVSPDEIQQMLEFLSSPIVSCVGRTKEGYFAIESLNTISKKFEYYGSACK